MIELTQKLQALPLQRLSARLLWQLKETLFLPWFGLMFLGWLMVASASTGIAEYYTGNEQYFAMRHAAYLLLGVTVTFVVSQVPLRWWSQT